MAENRYATKKTGPTEAYPFWNMEDIKNVVEWFQKNEEWDGYLITLLELLIGRRNGDIIMMKWSDLYFENGNRKTEINTITEQKTGKTTRIPISNMVFEAVEEYLNHVNVNPMEHYMEYIFQYKPKTDWINRRQLDIYAENNIDLWCEALGKNFSDKRKKKIIEDFNKQKKWNSIGDYLYYEVEYMDISKWETDDYRKKLKKAVKDVGITYRVSTHSLRKSMGYWIHKTHPFDPDCLLSLQRLFNHSSLQITMDYIGLSDMKDRKYLDDHGEFIHNVLAGKGEEIAKNMPVISLKSDDFGDIIMNVIRNIQYGSDPVETYQRAINLANEKRVM